MKLIHSIKKLRQKDAMHIFETEDIKNALELYETRLKGVSFLPLNGHGFKQAPYIPITEEEYRKMKFQFKKLALKEKDTHEHTEKFCSKDTCEVVCAK